MKPYQEGRRDARKWYKVAGAWHYPGPRNDYERGWNQYMRTALKWRAFSNGVFNFVVVLLIIALIYILLLFS